MTSLLSAACETLVDAGTSPALKAAAAEALLVALNEGLPVPTKTPWLIWVWMKSLPANRSWMSTEKLGAFPALDVRADALAVLGQPDAGDDLRDVAVDVLGSSGHAACVDDDVIVRLLDHARTDQHVRQAARLVQAVHQARNVSSELLRVIRDRWATSPAPSVREVAVEIATELVEPDVTFIATMLNDPNPDVRIAMANVVERCEVPGSNLSVGVVERRLSVEENPRARAALLRAQAELLEERPRRKRK